HREPHRRRLPRGCSGQPAAGDTAAAARTGVAALIGQGAARPRLAASTCGRDDRRLGAVHPRRLGGKQHVRWPDGFMWGTGASSTQCEGAGPASDWIDWERAGHAPVSGDGNGFADRYADDFRTYAGLGLRHHRLSIEWARIEPAEGEHDAAAIAH